MRTLIELVVALDEFEPEGVLFARSDWAPTSEAVVMRLTDDYRTPDSAKGMGLTYFLEVDVARRLREDEFGDAYSVHELCDRLIEYAINDA